MKNKIILFVNRKGRFYGPERYLYCFPVTQCGPSMFYKVYVRNFLIRGDCEKYLVNVDF